MEMERNMQAIVRTEERKKMQADARAQVDENACKYMRELGKCFVDTL